MAEHQLNLPNVNKPGPTLEEVKLVQIIQSDFNTPVFVAKLIDDQGTKKAEFFCPYCKKYHATKVDGDNWIGYKKACCSNLKSPLLTTGYYLINEKMSHYNLIGKKETIYT